VPELPEVETIARSLREGKSGPSLVGQTIDSVEVRWLRSVAAPSADEFVRRAAGQAFLAVGRRAKFLNFTLTHDHLLIHLRMSGDLRIEPEEESQPVATHDRLVFHLSNGWRLAFNDPRKFGRAWLLEDPRPVFENLGPEPLDPDFQADAFFAMLQARDRQLKPLLLDQNFLAGLGNIYTDEALHLAKLHPNLVSSQLNREEADRLFQAIRSVLQEGIRRNGASFDWVYRGGDFQNFFRVYQRTGQPCPVCGAPIQRRLVGQRGTHFCPVCQPEPVHQGR
jgi:formamidopyrimidine-DNA glycosylase